MAEWYFKPWQPGYSNREPVEGEFFATEGISDPGVALVREAVQNSLDARLAQQDNILIRIALSGEGGAADPSQASRYFEGVREHLEAEQSGLRRDGLPPPDGSCPYLVIEDFGTTGLTGDPSQGFRPKDESEKNHFYHFFRADGQSDKDPSDRGSWGIGKSIFPRSSRINCVFGVTVRADDEQTLLMGRMALGLHWVGEEHYQDGYFGVPPRDGRQLVMPVDDPGVIKRFCDTFGLQRGNGTGLSVVVPWPRPEITEEHLVRAVVSGYFWPILNGQLEVIVETPEVRSILDAESLASEVEGIGGELADDIVPLIRLAEWAEALPEHKTLEINMPEPTRRWQWSSELIPEEARASLSEALEKGEHVAIRVPVTVRSKDDPPERSFFDVFMVPDFGNRRDRPTFVREGLIIPNVNAPRTRGVLSLIVVEDPPLAAFLRDAENPAHTEWQDDGSKFRDKYESGVGDLNFVKRSVHEIVRILTASEQEEDVTLLADLFPSPTEHDGPPGQQADEEEGDDEPGIEPPEPPPPPPRPQPFRIQRLSDGFALVPANQDTVECPSCLDVRVAYDTRRGNPLKRYDPADFELDEAPISVSFGGLEARAWGPNTILADVTDPEFRLEVTGFDPNRDLYVRVKVREATDADQTP